MVESTPIMSTHTGRMNFKQYLTTTGFLVFLTLINTLLFRFVDYRALGMIYLMGITTASLYIRNYNIILATVLGALCWNILFIPPRFTFAISAPQDWALIVLYLVAGIVIGTFMKRLKANEARLLEEKNRATKLYAITKALSSAEDVASLIRIIHTEITNIFKCPSSVIHHEEAGKEFHPSKMVRVGNFPEVINEDWIIQSVVRKQKPSGKFTDEYAEVQGLYYPLIGEKKIIGIIVLNLNSFKEFTADNWLLLEAMARQLSTGLLRSRLEIELRGKMVDEESERIYKTLLNSVSHEIRTPLSAIKGFASALHEPEIIKDTSKIETVSDEIIQGVERLDYVVQNLLDMSRLESGNLKLKFDYADIVETINVAVRKVKKIHGEKQVTVISSEDLPLIYVDYFLIEQTFENIIRNAFLYTPPESPVEIYVDKDDLFLNVTITDHGQGIQGDNPGDIFKKFYRGNPKQSGGVGLGLSICKSIIELHKGYISLDKRQGKGASFIIKIPRELDRELQNS